MSSVPSIAKTGRYHVRSLAPKGPRPVIKIGDPRITIDVGGAQGQSFCVSKTILATSSPFFRAALSDRWIDVDNPVLHLPDDLPQTFEDYMSWVHDKTIRLPARMSDPKTKMLTHNHADWTRLYVFAEKVQTPALKLDIYNVLKHTGSFISEPEVLITMSVDELEMIWTEGAAESRLKRLICYRWARSAHSDQSTEELIERLPNMVLQCTRILMEYR